MEGGSKIGSKLSGAAPRTGSTCRHTADARQITVSYYQEYLYFMFKVRQR